jgi:uncharacterized membrane protein YoaK (UPF0700 family)
MSSLDIAASPPIRHDETVQVSLLLAFAGGYLDAYTWIIHGVMANAQTANLLLLWVYGTTGEWTRGLHFVPPIAIFAKVEGVTYSSVMITGNLRQAIEGLFAVVSGQFGSFRRPGIFAALCVAFGIGAAVGAYATKGIPDLALGLPVVALLIVLFRCEIRPNEECP